MMRFIDRLAGMGLLALRLVAPKALMMRARVEMYRLSGAKISNNVVIQPGAKLFGCRNITIESGVFLGDGVKIIAYGASIHLSRDALIASDCILISSSHVHRDICRPIKSQGYEHSPISIGEGAWLGFRSTVLAGVCIGKGSIIASHSVVNRNVHEYTVVGGVPAKFIKSRSASASQNDENKRTTC